MSGNYGGVMRMDTAYATGYVLETGLYCIYACLFIAALPGMTSARRLKDSNSKRSAWVFLSFSIAMFLVATLHLIFATFRFYKSNFLGFDPKGAIAYLKSPHHFEYMWLIILYCLQTWLGDALVIYRCYYVWDGNFLFIIIPVLLLLASMAVNIPIWYNIQHPGALTAKVGMRLFRCIYPVAFAQNVITTSLIILKIALQHRASQKAGVVHVGSRHSLIRVIRVVIESAALYTILLFLLVILYFRRDNAQFLVQAAINPSIGITFVLLAIRIQPMKHTAPTTGTDLGVSSTLIPAWLRNTQSDSEVGSVNGDRGNQNTLLPTAGTELAGVNKLTASQAGSSTSDVRAAKATPLAE